MSQRSLGTSSNYSSTEEDDMATTHKTDLKAENGPSVASIIMCHKA